MMLSRRVKAVKTESHK